MTTCDEMGEPLTVSLVDTDGREIGGTDQLFRGHDHDYTWEGHEMPLAIGRAVGGVMVRYADGRLRILPIPSTRLLATRLLATRLLDGITDLKVDFQIQEECDL